MGQSKSSSSNMLHTFCGASRRLCSAFESLFRGAMYCHIHIFQNNDKITWLIILLGAELAAQQLVCAVKITARIRMTYIGLKPGASPHCECRQTVTLPELYLPKAIPLPNGVCFLSCIGKRRSAGVVPRCSLSSEVIAVATGTSRLFTCYA